MIKTARLFLESITVSDYEQLQKALTSEFHVELSERKKRDSENIHEYVLQMKKIAALGYIEDISVIRYIVDGLPIKSELKYSLYNAKNFKELRDQYEILERVIKSEPNKQVYKRSENYK